jgi:hypothetical protein
LAAASSPSVHALADADYTIDIAPYSFEVSPHRTIKTIAYNQQVLFGAIVSARYT